MSRLSKQEIIRNLKDYIQTIEEVPTRRKWDDHENYIPHSDTIRRKFGTWNNALTEAGMEPNLERKGTKWFKCYECRKKVEKQISQISDTNKVFCSQSCSASYNNKSRGTPSFCKYCSRTTHNNRTTCNECLEPNFGRNKIIKDLGPPSRTNKNACIRGMSRRQYLHSNRQPSCQHCGYEKHFEVCHIQAIETFDESTEIAEVNNPLNLIALCRNCHWELDNGYLEIENHEIGNFQFCKTEPKRHTCKDCNVEIHKTSTRCRSCATKHLHKTNKLGRKTKIEWPSNNKLQKMVNKLGSYRQVGIKLGVSGAAVSKRLNK